LCGKKERKEERDESFRNLSWQERKKENKKKKKKKGSEVLAGLE
jgi:hypothetical protein